MNICNMKSIFQMLKISCILLLETLLVSPKQYSSSSNQYTDIYRLQVAYTHQNACFLLVNAMLKDHSAEIIHESEFI